MKKLKVFLTLAFIFSVLMVNIGCFEDGSSSFFEASISPDKTSMYSGQTMDLSVNMKWNKDMPDNYTIEYKWKIKSGSEIATLTDDEKKDTTLSTSAQGKVSLELSIGLKNESAKYVQRTNLSKDIKVIAGLSSTATNTDVSSYLTNDVKNKIDSNCTFTSSKPECATVNENGILTPVANGTTTITIKDGNGNVIATFDVEVSGFTTSGDNTQTGSGGTSGTGGTGEHMHSFDDQNWVYNSTNHFHTNGCTSICGAFGIAKDIAAHTFSNGVCSVCGYKQTPEGVVGGLFSVSSDKKVYFSKGNVTAEYVYGGACYAFDIAQNQYDYLGNTAGNLSLPYADFEDNAPYSTQTNGTKLDLFYYSFKDDSNAAVNTKYGMIYPSYPSSPMPYNIVGKTFVDWGKEVVITGNEEFRTLSKDEMEYLLKSRDNADSKYGFATLNIDNKAIKGLILLPDAIILTSWGDPTISFVPGVRSGFTANTYTKEKWNDFESRGAVFLPLAGVRTLNTDDKTLSLDEARAVYWLSKVPNGTGPSTFALIFDNGSASVGYNVISEGGAVRLVCDY